MAGAQGTWIKVFDEDSVLVEDGTDQAPRFRLLQADGTALELRLIGDLATAIPGPDVVLIEDLHPYRLGMTGPDDPESTLISWTTPPAHSNSGRAGGDRVVELQRRRVPLGRERLPGHLAAARR